MMLLVEQIELHQCLVLSVVWFVRFLPSFILMLDLVFVGSFCRAKIVSAPSTLTKGSSSLLTKGSTNSALTFAPTASPKAPT